MAYTRCARAAICSMAAAPCRSMWCMPGKPAAPSRSASRARPTPTLIAAPMWRWNWTGSTTVFLTTPAAGWSAPPTAPPTRPTPAPALAGHAGAGWSRSTWWSRAVCCSGVHNTTCNPPNPLLARPPAAPPIAWAASAGSAPPSKNWCSPRSTNSAPRAAGSCSCGSPGCW